MSKQDLLLLVHRIPFPPDKGDKIRSWHLFKHLCTEWNVHLGCYIDDPADQAYRPMLADMATSSEFISINPSLAKLRSLSGFMTKQPLSVAYYQSKSMQDYIRVVREKFQPCVEMAFSSSMAQHIIDGHSTAARVIDFCDSDAEKWRAYAMEKTGVYRAVYTREAKLLTALESKYINQSNASFAITPIEAKIFTDRPDIRETVDYWENGVDTAYYNPASNVDNRDAKNADLVFVGAMDYEPNINGVIWFSENIFPHIRDRDRNATFAIVGSKPTRRVRELESIDGIHVTGRVPDVRPWLASAKIVVAPLLVARGIQNKVLEAMAMAKPVIASTSAATGIRATSGQDIIIADDANEVLNKVFELLEDQDRRKEIGTDARKMVVDHYSWASKLQRLDNVLYELVQEQ